MLLVMDFSDARLLGRRACDLRLITGTPLARRWHRMNVGGDGPRWSDAGAAGELCRLYPSILQRPWSILPPASGSRSTNNPFAGNAVCRAVQPPPGPAASPDNARAQSLVRAFIIFGEWLSGDHTMSSRPTAVQRSRKTTVTLPDGTEIRGRNCRRGCGPRTLRCEDQGRKSFSTSSLRGFQRGARGRLGGG